MTTDVARGQVSAETDHGSGEAEPAGLVRVAIFDHQPVFSRGLALLLPVITGDRVRVVATSEDAAGASLLVRRTKPDLAVVDLNLAVPGGLRAIGAICRTEPQVPVVAMADGADEVMSLEEKVLAALGAGARGYVLKTEEPEALVSPLLAVLAGSLVVPWDALRDVLARSRRSPSPAGLTDEERLVWRLVAGGRSTQQIARSLNVSERTAKRVTAGVLRKLGAASRIDAARMAGQCDLTGRPARRPGGQPPSHAS